MSLLAIQIDSKYVSLAVSKTNLSVHEDKNRVPYVKVNMKHEQWYQRRKQSG